MRVLHEIGCTGTPPTFGCSGCIATARPATSIRRRRTQLLATALDAGVHPATRRPVDVDHHCADCRHLVAHRYAAASTKFTCALDPRGLHLRASWPACDRVEMAIPALLI